ncbi:MAG: TonB-dependent receptor plug domain-containing protein, partial [Methylophaga sp.]
MPYTTANGAENDKTLEPLLVTASRLGDITNQAASITVISAEDIRRSPSRTLPDLLAEQAGVNIVNTNEHKNSATVDIRGFGETAGQNTLILLDGRRLNDVDLSNVNYAAIPYQNIERIEIIRGSGAVLYGDGATGGVINIISKNPKNIGNQAIISTTAGSDDYL